MDEKTNKTLEDIKKLLVLALVRQGVQAKDIAAVLDVDPAIISRILASKKSKR